MPAAPPLDLSHPGRTDNNERFVAFAFAGADMVAEAEASGILTYAAGAFRSKFGRSPESFVGQPLRNLVASIDHEVVDNALALLLQRGRLLPVVIRLADPDRSCVALAGLAFSSQNRSLRLCLTFARLPAPAAAVLRDATGHGLARATEARLRSGQPCDLGLLEIVAEGGVALSAGEAIGHALERVAPDALTGEIAPGRFGLLGNGGTEADLLSVTGLLESMLRMQGLEIGITARHLQLTAEGLTPTQAVRALRQALNVFARHGAAGLAEAGLDAGLAGYMNRAGTRVASLRRAIRGGHFNLMFQPIVALANGATHHFEALIRPKPIPDCPFAGPQEFVMLVEALGLADELDLAVARVASDAAASAGVSVAFNLSGQSVQSAPFLARLTDLLRSHPARETGLIMVEMTETAEIEDLEQALCTANALRSLGVPFCLDDFGAGAADMRLLRALTADIVKLDGSYVPGVALGGRERAFVAGMVEIARAAGAAVVAERVETKAEAEALRELGVQYGQGWLFGRPVPRPGAGRPVATAPTRKILRRAGEKRTWLVIFTSTIWDSSTRSRKPGNLGQPASARGCYLYLWVRVGPTGHGSGGRI